MPTELFESFVTLEFYAGLTTGALAAESVHYLAQRKVQDVTDEMTDSIDQQDEPVVHD